MNNNGRFCVVGNVSKQHKGEDGKTYYGTKAFKGGTKIYIYSTYWYEGKKDIAVIALNRFGRFIFESVPVDLIENVRVKTVFEPKVLELMEADEVCEGMEWLGRTKADKRRAEQFVEMWNREIISNNNNK